MEWFVVNTRLREEDLAEQHLRRLELETFAPRIRQLRVIRWKQRVVIGPLFPGYLFVRCNLEMHYRAVNYAHGVRCLVAFGLTPARVDERLIDSIKSRLHDGYLTVQPSVFRKGDMVRITAGPFQGLEAVFEREMSDRQRGVLLIQALSAQLSVVVDLKQVTSL